MSAWGVGMCDRMHDPMAPSFWYCELAIRYSITAEAGRLVIGQDSVDRMPNDDHATITYNNEAFRNTTICWFSHTTFSWIKKHRETTPWWKMLCMFALAMCENGQLNRRCHCSKYRQAVYRRRRENYHPSSHWIGRRLRCSCTRIGEMLAVETHKYRSKWLPAHYFSIYTRRTSLARHHRYESPIAMAVKVTVPLTFCSAPVCQFRR